MTKCARLIQANPREKMIRDWKDVGKAVEDIGARAGDGTVQAQGTVGLAAYFTAARGEGERGVEDPLAALALRARLGLVAGAGGAGEEHALPAAHPLGDHRVGELIERIVVLFADGGDEVALAHLGGAGDPHARGELLQLGQAHRAECAGSARLLRGRGSGGVASAGVGHEGPFPS